MSILDCLGVLTNFEFLTQGNYLRLHITDAGLEETRRAIDMIFPDLAHANGQELTTALMFRSMLQNQEYEPLDHVRLSIQEEVTGVIPVVSYSTEVIIPLLDPTYNEGITQEVTSILTEADQIAATFHRGILIEEAAHDRFLAADANPAREIFYDQNGRVIELFRNQWILDASPEMQQKSVDIIANICNYQHRVDQPVLPLHLRTTPVQVPLGTLRTVHSQEIEQEEELMADEEIK